MFALGVSAALGGIQNPKLIMLQKDLKFHQDAILGIAAALVNVCVSIGTALVLRSYWAPIAGLLAGQAVSIVLSYIIFPFRPALRVKHFRELWQFSAWVSISQIVNTLNYRFDHLLVGTLLGRAELGLYTVGGRLAVVPGQELVRPLTSTLFPAFSLAGADTERLKRAYQRVQGVVTAACLADECRIRPNRRPVRAARARPVMAPGHPDHSAPGLHLFAGYARQSRLPLAMAKGETRSLFLRNCLKLGVRVPLILIGMPAGGLIGLLIGRAIAGFHRGRRRHDDGDPPHRPERRDAAPSQYSLLPGNRRDDRCVRVLPSACDRRDGSASCFSSPARLRWVPSAIWRRLGLLADRREAGRTGE